VERAPHASRRLNQSLDNHSLARLVPGFDFDLFVVGAGSGGVRAARTAAQRGVRVAVAEAGAIGGTCVNVGCIPKKLYSYAAGYAEAFEESAGYGWLLGATAQFDWGRLKKARVKEIARLNAVYCSLLDSAGVVVLPGIARLVDAHTLEIGDVRHTARHIIVATGGSPSVPSFPGSEHLVTSDAAFDFECFPKRLLVVGGGYIACEFASIFNGLGAEVTLVHRGADLLTGFDDDIRRFAATEMVKAGVKLSLETELSSISLTSGGYGAVLSSGQSVEADKILCATGRVPNTQRLGLAAAKVGINESGRIIVDEQYRTSVPSIFAIGDVSSRMQLTPIATAEAMVVTDALYGEGNRGVDYEYVPTAVFTHPNIGSCGYSESEARKVFGEVRVFTTEFKSLRHTLSGRSERTFMKLVVQSATDRVIGLHMVGSDAGEIVQGFAVAMRAGATKALFDSTVGIHPTAAEEFVTMRMSVAS
jgi:glutathione reductase (NADPH)